jgi:Resolvase, N terminal domain
MNTLIKPKKAYSYQRFSSAKQRHGDSVRRQAEAAERFCKEHYLLLVDTFRDEGVSGFHGRNFSDESALSAFLKLVEKGTIEKGSVLVVENMDRRVLVFNELIAL